jgi:hypothetical protein
VMSTARPIQASQVMPRLLQDARRSPLDVDLLDAFEQAAELVVQVGALAEQVDVI